MAKKYYRINLSGYGGEIALGRLTEEQYDFWAPMDEEYIIEHCMGDPWEETDDNPVHDDEDPRWLGQWYELTDIAHENGPDAGNCWIQIEEYDGPAYDSNFVGDIVTTSDWSEFETKYKPTVDNCEVDLDEILYPNGHYEEGDNEGEPKPLDDGTTPLPYVFFGMSMEKGTFSECIVECEGDIDPSKLRFIITKMPNGDSLLNLTEYDGEYVDEQGGSTNGKGYYAQVWDW
jgi:hypothetical protein